MLEILLLHSVNKSFSAIVYMNEKSCAKNQLEMVKIQLKFEKNLLKLSDIQWRNSMINQINIHYLLDLFSNPSP